MSVRVLAALLAAALGLSTAGCEQETASDQAPADQPSILVIVWDTVRADHLGLYGHERQTTPFLDQWAAEARVYEDCISAGNSTLPAHASMFTGRLPSEHGMNHERARLSTGYDTLAELLQAAGYRTYLYSENPYVSHRYQLAQGFQVVEHPWDPQYQELALSITRSKLNPADESTELVQKLRQGRLNEWSIKAAGELVQRGLASWLAGSDQSRPFFAFLNYMEAHRPLIPHSKYRARFMTPQQVQASYKVDRTWTRYWSYTFGLAEYSPEEIELTRLTYDAAIFELDTLLHELLTTLKSTGALDNTVVILTADHGEHLGEHHMFDHQFSVYQELLHVPLIVHYPKRFAPGRDGSPVSNFDLFPTLLELAGVAAPAPDHALSLFRPQAERRRLGECPGPLMDALTRVKDADPQFDTAPWSRALRAFYHAPHKLIAGSDGRGELYDLQQDPTELHDLLAARARVGAAADI